MIALPLLAASILSAASTSPAASEAPGLCPLGGFQQLRIYEIFDTNKAAFHARFRDHAHRIMKRYGFNVLAVWETKQGERTELVYLLQWPDEAAMRRSWETFLADEEWKRVKRETGATQGKLVGEIEDRTLTRTEYSPC